MRPVLSSAHAFYIIKPNIYPRKKQNIVSEYLYFSKEGFTVKLNEKEAEKKGVNPEHYKKFKNQVALFNQSIEARLDTLGNNKIDFFFYLDKTDTSGLDRRLIIIDNNTGEKIDMAVSGENK